MKAAIDSIVIKERIRKEITRIPELASNIGSHGLLNPVTVMGIDGGKLQLLAGLRRVKAVQYLGWTEIDVNVVSPADAEAALRIEFSENDQREEFTYSEYMDYSRLLEEIEKAKALERMSLGGKGGVDEGMLHGAYLEKGTRRDAVGAKIGMSGSTYDRAKYIAEHAPPEIIEQLDRGERSIRSTYDELRAKEKSQAEPPAPKFASSSRAAKNDPVFQKIKADEAQAIHERQAFDALPADKKIAELERRIEEQRIRAVAAETDLARLREDTGIEIDHKTSRIEGLLQEKANLTAALDKANARIAELEAIHGEAN
jgi:ParB family chromosome partitioning protein